MDLAVVQAWFPRWGDKIRGFCGSFSIAIALAERHADDVNTRPLFLSRKPVDIAGGKIATGCDTAVVFINSFRKFLSDMGPFGAW